jgi:hypothetical protein
VLRWTNVVTAGYIILLVVLVAGTVVGLWGLLASDDAHDLDPW